MPGKNTRTPFALALFMLLSLLLSWSAQAASEQEATYEQRIQDWRQKRHDRLADDNGWMTLVALEWLQEGENTIGSGKNSDAVIPGGPQDWGVIVLQGDDILYLPVPGAGITVDGVGVDGGGVEEAVLVADNQGQPTVVRSGDISFYVINRGSYGLRVKDRKAPALLAFDGMPVYDIEPGWRIEGRFIRAPEGETIPISDVLGQTNPSPVFGTFEFERDGLQFSLIAIGTSESESLWFLFADKTSGRETYGAGRFLYSDGMPENGRLVVDFNKAYNPPCAYNDYSTCPLPPQQNRLRLAVQAGEKKYHD